VVQLVNKHDSDDAVYMLFFAAFVTMIGSFSVTEFAGSHGDHGCFKFT